MFAEIVGHPPRPLLTWRHLVAQIAAAVPSSSRFSKDTTVSELISWWLHSIAHHRVRPSTFDSYQRFGRYLSEAIGGLRVVDVDAETVIQWQSNQLDKLAPLTVLNSRKVARQAFAEAAKLRLIPANPFDLVRPPPPASQSAG